MVQGRSAIAMAILTLNAGSSSIKYALFDAHAGERLAEGRFERIGEPGGDCADHDAGFRELLDRIEPRVAGLGPLDAVAHRVVHGGEAFAAPTPVDDAVRSALQALVPLAPLHMPANLCGIDVARARYPALMQLALFDTAFHHSLPECAWRYGLPESCYTEHRIRRYGFHGLSHQYLARRAAQLLGRDASGLKLITLHLGNGASATAVDGGRSVDTTMGFTPVEGLLMGTRCGDLDATVPLYLQRSVGLGADAVDRLLNRDSGLAGLSGHKDMRDVLAGMEAGDERAARAFELFCYRVRKTIGAYLAALGGLDAVVFSGGIGRHQAAVRARCVAGLEVLGIRLDERRNATAADGDAFEADGAAVRLLVLDTDEELEMARQTRGFLDRLRNA
jgi:acetate kinase